MDPASTGAFSQHGITVEKLAFLKSLVDQGMDFDEACDAVMEKAAFTSLLSSALVANSAHKRRNEELKAHGKGPESSSNMRGITTYLGSATGGNLGVAAGAAAGQAAGTKMLMKGHSSNKAGAVFTGSMIAGDLIGSYLGAKAGNGMYRSMTDKKLEKSAKVNKYLFRNVSEMNADIAKKHGKTLRHMEGIKGDMRATARGTAESIAGAALAGSAGYGGTTAVYKAFGKPISQDYKVLRGGDLMKGKSWATRGAAALAGAVGGYLAGDLHGVNASMNKTEDKLNKLYGKKQ